MTKREQADRMNAEGLALKESGKLAEALDCFHAAASADQSWSVPLYNVGLIAKTNRNWNESLEYNRRASQLNPTDEAAWWNLGIAATALGQWDVARLAWRSFGIQVADGEGPIDLPCGVCPIRLNPNGDGEVVWATRIDPARAVLEGIPFPEAKHRWRDVVLNDGAPTGYRKFQGKEVPVFDAIEILEPSPFGTFVTRIAVSAGTDSLASLTKMAIELHGNAEDWTTSVRMLCQACSEGRPHEFHDTAMKPAEGKHTVGIAAKSRGHAEEILSTWESSITGARVEWLDDALEPGA
jgi:tetratricopeptide (TPR) repeat protein